VHTERGLVRARHVIVTVDGGLERLLPELATRVRSARLQMLATEPTTEINLPRPVYARWGYDYWQQRPDGAIALGGGRDLGGESEWTANATPTPVVQDALERRLRDTLGVQAPITHRWAATVGYTQDGMPVVSEVRPGVWAVGGYSGTGNVIGALMGRGIARWLVGGDDQLLRPFLH
jgi:gamma-glutamylputrescine oxidase